MDGFKVKIIFKNGGEMEYFIGDHQLIEHSTTLFNSLKKSRELKTFTQLIFFSIESGAIGACFAIEDVSGFMMTPYKKQEEISPLQQKFVDTQIKLMELQIKKLSEGEEWRPS